MGPLIGNLNMKTSTVKRPRASFLFDTLGTVQAVARVATRVGNVISASDTKVTNRKVNLPRRLTSHLSDILTLRSRNRR